MVNYQNDAQIFIILAAFTLKHERRDKTHLRCSAPGYNTAPKKCKGRCLRVDLPGIEPKASRTLSDVVNHSVNQPKMIHQVFIQQAILRLQCES